MLIVIKNPAPQKNKNLPLNSPIFQEKNKVCQLKNSLFILTC